jgi:16S rRNA (guanine527-N7)-methyltransferase
MTPDASTSEISLLRAAEAAGIALAPDEAPLLARHLTLVYEAGREQNLTRVPRDDAEVLHVVDSLMGAGAMADGGEGAWADLGSGAGFPGVPLCIHGHRHVDLIESVGKKANFLTAAVRQLCLDATVRGSRAEDAAQETPMAFSAVSVRAVGQLAETVELSSPLLREGGVLVAWKGALTAEEARRGDAVASLVGMSPGAVTRYELPGSDARRCLVVYRKVGKAAVGVPRRPGLAHSRPLA